MDGRKVRAAGALLVTLALTGLAAAPALAAPGVSVSELSSLKAGATVGTLTGTVVNETSRATQATVTVRIMRRGMQRRVVGSTAVDVAARGSATYRVKVQLPSGLSRGNYYLSACTPYGGSDKGQYGCATAQRDVLVKGGIPVRGPMAAAQYAAPAAKAKTSAAEVCSSGAHSLAKPGERVYPEVGNGGYQSLHTDIFTVYDAVTNLFLTGNHVDLTQRSTQCLSDFSLDFDKKNSITSTTIPGPDMTVESVTIDGQPATFTFKQPTYPGDPNGQDDPDPLAHVAGLTNPVSATNPNPPACAPTGTGAAAQGVQCPATKLVITPSAPIPSGTTFKVTVNYVGRPGVRPQGSGSTEGWFRNNTPAGDGAMVTSEPLGSMAWMPLNDHTSVKPTYDIHSTVNYDPAIAPELNRVFVANGRLISTTINPPDANYPAGGSRTFYWKSPEPIAAYLVENSVGHFELTERFADSGVIYYEAQAAGIAATRKASNKVIMDQQEDITLFQELFNGKFPFSTNGILIALPSASFEEEMQTKIVFVGGSIGSNASTFSHENMHQWWGDNVSYSDHRYTFFKEGYATTAEYYFTARAAAVAAGGMGTAAGDAAFETSIRNRFNTNYNTTSTSFWNVAPSNPTSGNLFGTANTYTRPGTSYLALRAILGPQNFNDASKEIQHDFGGGSISEAQELAVFHKYLNKVTTSAACSAKLDAFFKQWWDTGYTGSPAAGNRPQITGPGLAGQGFFDASGNCADFAVAPVSGSVPATLSLTLGAPASFGAFAPGVAKDYTASTTANVITTAGDSTLSVADPSTVAAGHLVNGTFSLPQALKAKATSTSGTSAAEGAVGGSPLGLLTWTGPTSNDTVGITFTQGIGVTDALRTGAYSKTLTFTLATTTP